jgi:methylated-DNA-[protein]-cysteine S-methyltransferase
MSKKCYYYDTKIGMIGIVEENNLIVEILFGKKEDIIIEETSLIKETYHQIKEYLDGKRRMFDVPIKYDGTTFQKNVWGALYNIPYGQTVSYGDIARKINNPAAVRAVGMTCHNNPIPIIIPCHRVIGKNGKLTGFGGGLEIKEELLRIERGNKNV